MDYALELIEGGRYVILPTPSSRFPFNGSDGIGVGGRYGEEVEHYLDVYLRTESVPSEGVARALVARGKARREAGQRLLVCAERGESPSPRMKRGPKVDGLALCADFRDASKVDPSNTEVKAYLRDQKYVRSTSL